MAKVYRADDDTFAQMTYARYQPGVTDFIQQQMQQAQMVMSNVGQTFFQSAQKVFMESLDNPAIRIANAAIRQIQNLWGTNSIQYLPELHRIQNAPAIMIPFIMANESLSALHAKGRCVGYGDMYVPLQVGAIGQDNLHWRAMNSGMVNMDEETDDWVATTYSSSFDDLVPVQLSFEDQVDLRHTQLHINHAIENGRDPTSKWDDDL